MARTADEWLKLSMKHDRQGGLGQAHICVQRALQLEPSAPVALLQRARCAMALGDAQQAADDCRALIARNVMVARAWFMLADLKIIRLSDIELAALAHAAAEPPATMPAEERLYLQFALGKALEDAGRRLCHPAVRQRACRCRAPVGCSGLSAHGAGDSHCIRCPGARRRRPGWAAR